MPIPSTFLPNAVNKKTTIEPNLSLEYKPLRPSHASQIGQTLTQIIQPGKPLPDGSKGNGSSQPSISTEAASTNQPSTENIANNPGLLKFFNQEQKSIKIKN